VGDEKANCVAIVNRKSYGLRMTVYKEENLLLVPTLSVVMNALRTE
jgi:hypothetical protein